jgi:hypothetical protein
MKRRKPDGREKMTPISWRKTERKVSSTSKSREVSAAHAGERGKMIEGLQLRFAIANNKIGKSTKKILN